MSRGKRRALARPAIAEPATAGKQHRRPVHKSAGPPKSRLQREAAQAAFSSCPAMTRSSSAELLVLQPMRDDRIRAQAAHLVGFVILEVALEPFYVTIALE